MTAPAIIAPRRPSLQMKFTNLQIHKCIDLCLFWGGQPLQSAWPENRRFFTPCLRVATLLL